MDGGGGERLKLDAFVLDHNDGVVDPLKDYYNTGLLLSFGGGPQSIQTLDAKPQTLIYELNEWLQFDKPSRYRMYVVSTRLSERKPHAKESELIPAVSYALDHCLL